jgi:hypothetical protein
MLTLLLIGMLTLAFNIKQSKADPSEIPATEWSRTYGGPDLEVANSVQQTSDGGFVATGRTNSFGAGYGDFWLVKTDADGDVQWNQTYGGTSSDLANSVQQTDDGGYIIGGYTYSFGAGNGDFWLVKTDVNGNIQWSKTYGGISDDEAYSVQQTCDGGYIIAGITASFGAGGLDFWLVKTDPNGNMQWNHTYGGISSDRATSVRQTVDGGYIVAGITQSFSAGFEDVWLIKTNANGNVQWSRTYGGSGQDRAYSVQQTVDGGYIVAGSTLSFAGFVDFWLVKTDVNGSVEWSEAYGDSSVEVAYSVEQTSDGGYIVAGAKDLGGLTSGEFWLVRTDANGHMRWNATYGGAGHDEAMSVQQTDDWGYIVAGYSASFGTGGDYDFWLIKLAAETYTLTIAVTTGGTTSPLPGTYSYTANSLVQVTAIPDAGYLFDYWELDRVNVGSANPYTVLMDKDHTLKAVFSSIPPPLSASISPLSESINVGQSVTFTSTVSGGYTPYTYQWYLSGAPVSGTNATSWTFTPTTAGIYYVYLKVTDDKGNTAQSETARITVTTVPVGGYSISIRTPATAKTLTLYIILTAILTIALTTIKHETKRKKATITSLTHLKVLRKSYGSPG